MASGLMSEVIYRPARASDVTALLALEAESFEVDKLSRRSFRHHIQSELSDLIVACEESNQGLLGYGLSFCLRGTRLARLYSLAVSAKVRGQGIARNLIENIEQASVARGRLYLRLEVAKQNLSAINLYRACGYQVFGEYHDYYEDHTDALRMQKRIMRLSQPAEHRQTPWYQQSTEFTCGPAALMMAMASFNSTIDCNLETELALWREATTIFMTSGHGGCHPFGLALAAKRRGFNASVWVNSEQPLFLEGVRSEHKKHIMHTVHDIFLSQCQKHHVVIKYEALSLDAIAQCVQRNQAVLLLISTYRLDGRKAPHWVTVTGVDEHCLYVHDPDVDEAEQSAIDCQHVPIAKADVEKMANFGAQRLRAAVVIDQS